jgi:hypothetical protein
MPFPSSADVSNISYSPIGRFSTRDDVSHTPIGRFPIRDDKKVRHTPKKKRKHLFEKKDVVLMPSCWEATDEDIARYEEKNRRVNKNDRCVIV